MGGNMSTEEQEFVCIGELNLAVGDEIDFRSGDKKPVLPHTVIKVEVDEKDCPVSYCFGFLPPVDNRSPTFRKIGAGVRIPKGCIAGIRRRSRGYRLEPVE